MIGIIGGTGLYSIEGLSNINKQSVSTPFGTPSAPVVIGQMSSSQVAFLPRHGEHHELLPSEINYRANIWALKSVGVTQVISVSAVGSLAEDLCPGELVVPNQYFDFTRGKRAASFFGDGLVAHISSAEPVCSRLSQSVVESGYKTDIRIHTNKTYACVEGPRLGTKAESFFLKNSGCHIVGMTNLPEAFLAREAQLCYCTIAIVTDYDCWKDDPGQHVTLEKVIELYSKSLDRVKKLLTTVLRAPALRAATQQVPNSQSAKLPSAGPCQCRQSLKDAVLTNEDSLSDSKREVLQFLKV